VSSFEENEGTGGIGKTIKLTDTKEILKNIPVQLDAIGNLALEKLNNINNVLYAYKDGDYEISDDVTVPYRNKRGLIMAAIKEALDGRVFTYFPKNEDGAVQLQQYEINIDRMFAERQSGRSNSEYMLTEGVFTSLDGNLEDDADTGGDDQFITYEDNNKICSEEYRIGGEYKSLLGVIDEAMSGNACDWYVYAYEKDNPTSLVTGYVNNTIVIEIRPISRSDFDQFTEDEFNAFVAEFDEVTESKMFGRELANEESNKIFFGSKYEYYQKIEMDSFNQFWGFKTPDTAGVEPIKEITDRYGNKIQVKGEIYTNPTFETSMIPAVSVDTTLLRDVELRNIITSSLGQVDRSELIDTYSREELIDEIKTETTFEDSYTFDLNDPEDETMFNVLRYTYKRADLFKEMLLCVYHFADWYLRYKDEVAEYKIRDASSESVTWFVPSEDPTITDVTFCNSDVQIGEQLEVPGDYLLNVNLSFTHTLEDGQIRGRYQGSEDSSEIKAEKAISVAINSNTIYEKILDPEDLVSETYTINITNIMKAQTETDEDILKLNIPVMNYGLHCIDIRVKYSEVSEETFEFESKIARYRFWVEYFGTKELSDGQIVKVNPYQEVMIRPLYQWAKALMLPFLANVNFDNALEEGTGKTIQDALSNVIAHMNFYDDADGAKRRRASTLSTRYANWQLIKLHERFTDLYDIVFNYLDPLVGKKFIREYTNRDWVVVPECWDGEAGQALDNQYVRGKFINKENGKMPCLYYIENAKNLTLKTKDREDLLQIKAPDEKTRDFNVISLWGKTSVELFAVGKTREEANDTRYIIMNLNNKIEKYHEGTGTSSIEFETATQGNTVNGAVQSFVVFYNSIKNTAFAKIAERTLSLALPTLVNKDYTVKPDYVYIPTMHSYIRYGPWILDYRIGDNSTDNRSNYGTTPIVYDNNINPWEFNTYNDVNNYISKQYENSMMTQYQLNRGQIVTADIPRYNFGVKIGNFSNISSLSITWGVGGVSTTYTLTAFGAGRVNRQLRDKEHLIHRLRNVEDKLNQPFDFMNQIDFFDIVGGGTTV